MKKTEYSKPVWTFARLLRFLKDFILPFITIGVSIWLSTWVADCRSKRERQRNEEVRLSVTLDELEYTPTTSTGETIDSVAIIASFPDLPSGNWKISSAVSTNTIITSNKIPVYTITNLGDRPVNVSDIFFKIDGKKTYWGRGWWDATGDTFINPPYHLHLNPDTAIHITTKTPVDTIAINIHSLFIALASGEVKEFAPQWSKDMKETHSTQPRQK